MAQSVEATNIIEVIRTPSGLLAIPAGRGIWFGTDLLAQEQEIPDGDVVVRLHRGDATSANLVIPVTDQDVGPILAAVEVSLTPSETTYTFPADTATFTNQVIAEIALEITTSGTAGEADWDLVGEPAGYSLSDTGTTRQVLYSGSRPTSPESFLVQVNVPRTDSAQGGSDSALVRTTLIAPPQRTAATIADITRTNLDDFTQNITQLFTGSDLTWSIFSSNVAVTAVSLNDSNIAEFDPAADGTATITVLVFNNGGSAQYTFDVTFDVLQQPVIAWPSASYSEANSRYEFSTGTSAVQVPLGVLLPTVSVPSGTVGSVVLDVSSALAGAVRWEQTGGLSLEPGAASSDRQYIGQLVVTVSPTATVRGATFTRNLFIEVSSSAVPVTPPQRNPAFVPTGGLTRTVRVGEFFDIDWTGAFIGNVPIVPVVQNEELIRVALRAGDVTRCFGLREGSTTYIVSGAWVVRVTVIAAAAAPTATTSGWYRRQTNGSFAQVSSLAATIEENSARQNLFSSEPLFLVMTEIEDRPVTFQERPALAGLDVSAAAAAAIALPGGSVQARRVDIFANGANFDYEEQNTYAVNVLAEADTETIDGTVYEAHTALIPLALTVSDVFEPTAAPSFASDDAAVNLPAGSDGSVSGFSLGTFAAGQGATYGLDASLASLFAVDGSGELTFIGGASSAVVGNSWTVTITATNSLGSDTIEILVTVKAVVTLSFDPASVSWKLPVGTTSDFTLGSIVVNSASNDIRGLPPLPSLSVSGDDAQFIETRATSHNAFDVVYTGEAATLATSDLDFSLDAASVENGLCLAASASLAVGVPSVPATPIFSDPSYTFNLTDGTDPPPAAVIGLPTATHAAGESQRWRIITAQTGRRLFAINAADGEFSYTGPDAASLAVTALYSLLVGVVNIDGSKESIEATQTFRVPVVPSYSPPTANGSWSPGSIWTKAADGSFSGTIQTGTANQVSIDISVGPTGPWAIQSGLTANYRNQTIPSPPTHYSVTRSDGVFTVRGLSAGSETLHLFMSDGTTEEVLVFHVQIVAATTTATSEAVWYEDGAGLTYDVVDSKGITISFPEGQAAQVSANIYATYTEIENRTNATLAEPTQAGFDIVVGGILRRQITVGSETIWIDAWQINIDPTQFDFETQSRYDLQAVLNVPQATVGSTTYAAVHKPIDIHLVVTNIAEPPNRTAQAAPADFDLRRRGRIVDLSLQGYWISEDDPDRNNLAYRLVQSVVGASAGQSTNAADYLSASLIGDTFQANAGTGATLTPSGVRIRFDVYCREASTGIENSTPLTFYCDEVHSRALEDSPLTWASSVPERLEFAVAEDVSLPHLLRNNIFAESTVADMSAEAGAISYSLREPTFWIVRNTAFQWDGTLDLASGGTHRFDMANAFQILGPDAAGKTWTLSQSSDDASVLTVAVVGKIATVTASDSLTAAGSTNFYLYGSDGNFVETYTGYADVAAMRTGPPGTIAKRTSSPGYAGIMYNGSQATTSDLDFYVSALEAGFSFYNAGTYIIPASRLFADHNGTAEIYQIGSGTTASLGSSTLSIVDGGIQAVITGSYADLTTTVHGRLIGDPATTASISVYFEADT